jgi:hypothetical protein
LINDSSILFSDFYKASILFDILEPVFGCPLGSVFEPATFHHNFVDDSHVGVHFFFSGFLVIGPEILVWRENWIIFLGYGLEWVATNRDENSCQRI